MEALVPVFTPLTRHRYWGLVPPLPGVAVNVTGVPEQTGPAGTATILTAGVSAGLTTIVTVLDVAVAGEGQTALEVITTVTISPLVNEDELKVEAFAPVFTPFTTH